MSAPPPLPPLPPKPPGGASSSHPYETYETYGANPYSANPYAAAPTNALRLPGGPPPVPPLPPQILQQEQRYLTPSPYEFADDHGGPGGMRTATPMIAPRAQRVDRSIPHEVGVRVFVFFLPVFCFFFFFFFPLSSNLRFAVCISSLEEILSLL
ncbi:hypothetical protein D9619_013517 [Psilocybe cf. subviscida]|uniref:Uncharacterized protein n=1 Tax=Psilocybe cf. subviscida TaxID=2480587 RepID=A0A8H5BHI1_9AGAR|nr:hypothetical protein D9619_013517 [Psilocybe cf. subviscida]